MKFNRYTTTEDFKSAALDTLLLHEEQNNVLIGLLRWPGDVTEKGWLLSTVTDDDGKVMLVAACTPPKNIIIYERNNEAQPEAIASLISELKAEKLAGLGMLVGGAVSAASIKPPGVMAERNTAKRFADVYAGVGNWHIDNSLNAMRLDKIEFSPKG